MLAMHAAVSRISWLGDAASARHHLASRWVTCRTSRAASVSRFDDALLPVTFRWWFLVSFSIDGIRYSTSAAYHFYYAYAVDAGHDSMPANTFTSRVAYQPCKSAAVEPPAAPAWWRGGAMIDIRGGLMIFVSRPCTAHAAGLMALLPLPPPKFHHAV